MACKENQYYVAKKLLEEGAQVDLQDRTGWSAFMFATHEGHTELAKLLLEYNADVDLQSVKWESALSLAILHGHTEIITLIEVTKYVTIGRILPVV